MTRLLAVNRTQGEEGPTLPVFTVDIDPKRNGSVPTFEIGKIDLQKANGPLSYAPVNHTTGRWLVEDVAFEVAGQIANVTGAMVIGSYMPPAGNRDAESPVSRTNSLCIIRYGWLWIFQCSCGGR